MSYTVPAPCRCTPVLSRDLRFGNISSPVLRCTITLTPERPLQGDKRKRYHANLQLQVDTKWMTWEVWLRPKNRDEVLIEARVIALRRLGLISRQQQPQHTLLVLVDNGLLPGGGSIQSQLGCLRDQPLRVREYRPELHRCFCGLFCLCKRLRLVSEPLAFCDFLSYSFGQRSPSL